VEYEGAADEAVLIKVHKKKKSEHIPPFLLFSIAGKRNDGSVGRKRNYAN
jgi:hypothetical protein